MDLPSQPLQEQSEKRPGNGDRTCEGRSDISCLYRHGIDNAVWDFRNLCRWIKLQLSKVISIVSITAWTLKKCDGEQGPKGRCQVEEAVLLGILLLVYSDCSEK